MMDRRAARRLLREDAAVEWLRSHRAAWACERVGGNYLSQAERVLRSAPYHRTKWNGRELQQRGLTARKTGQRYARLCEARKIDEWLEALDALQRLE